MTTAKERYREAAAALQEHWRLIKQEVVMGAVRLTQRQIEAMAGEYYRDQTQQHQDIPGDLDEWDAAVSALKEMGQAVEGLSGCTGRIRTGYFTDARCRLTPTAGRGCWRPRTGPM